MQSPESPNPSPQLGAASETAAVDLGIGLIDEEAEARAVLEIKRDGYPDHEEVGEGVSGVSSGKDVREWGNEVGARQRCRHLGYIAGRGDGHYDPTGMYVARI